MDGINLKDFSHTHIFLCPHITHRLLANCKRPTQTIRVGSKSIYVQPINHPPNGYFKHILYLHFFHQCYLAQRHNKIHCIVRSFFVGCQCKIMAFCISIISFKLFSTQAFAASADMSSGRSASALTGPNILHKHSINSLLEQHDLIDRGGPNHMGDMPSTGMEGKSRVIKMH